MSLVGPRNKYQLSSLIFCVMEDQKRRGLSFVFVVLAHIKSQKNLTYFQSRYKHNYTHAVVIWQRGFWLLPWSKKRKKLLTHYGKGVIKSFLPSIEKKNTPPPSSIAVGEMYKRYSKKEGTVTIRGKSILSSRVNLNSLRGEERKCRCALSLQSISNSW
jgi:hypothetical protein